MLTILGVLAGRFLVRAVAGRLCGAAATGYFLGRDLTAKREP